MPGGDRVNYSENGDFEKALSLYPPEIAAEMEKRAPDEAWKLLISVPVHKRADVYFRLSPQLRKSVCIPQSPEQLADLMRCMHPDQRVDFLKSLPEVRKTDILRFTAQAERDKILALSEYPEGSAGSVMTSEYAALSPGLYVKEALDLLRREAPDHESIHNCFVLDDNHHLIGAVSLRQLVMAMRDHTVEELMTTPPISANVDDDQEVAVRRMFKYGLVSLPVIDASGLLCGIITHDDAVHVLQEEQNEDMERLMGIVGTHEPGHYKSITPLGHFKKRIGWLTCLSIIGITSGMILHTFEATLDTLVILAIYIPMIADSGGNAGSQSATVVIRALSTGQIQFRDMFSVLKRELITGLLLSVVLGTIAFAKVYFLSQGSQIPDGMSLLNIGIAIAIALSVQVMSATAIGALLPMGVSATKLDPAVVASPAITTIVDITGLLIYFFSVKTILGI